MTRFGAHVLATTSFAALAIAAFPVAAFAQDTQSAVTDTQSCDNVPAGAERDDCLARANAGIQSTGEGENIVVTGSRIARPNYDTDAPAVIISSEQIENRGFETLGQAINEQPSFGVPGASPVGNGQAGSFGSGQSFVNFLGLGDQRTLVLVDGHRFVSSNTASIFGPSNAGVQVDLNGINTRLVERVETVAIGGAPIYGSDAIAGTVNIVLRHDYEGLEVDGQYGISDEGDAPNYRLRGIWGMNFGGGRGNVTISGEYNRGQGLVYNSRLLTRQAPFYGDCPDGSQFTTCLFLNRRLPSVSESGAVLAAETLGFPISPEQATDVNFFEGFLNSNGLPGDLDGDGNPGTMSDVYVAFGAAPGTTDSVVDAQGRALQFDPNGNLVPIDFGTRIGGPGTFNTDFSGGNGYDLNNTQQLLTDTERYNANLLASYELTSNIRAKVEGWYSFSRGVNLREQPVYNSGLFDAAGTPDGDIVVSIDNPFLSPQARSVIAASLAQNPLADPNFFLLSRANTDLISGRASSETEVWRFVGSLDGDFHVGWRDWRWEVVANYGHAHGEGCEPQLVQQNFENAVDAVADANGNIICRPGYVNAGIATISSTCAPLDLFGTGKVSQAARDYVTAIADPSSTNEQFDFVASLSGPLFRLPGGDMLFALGYEHRRESTQFDPGAFFFGADDPDPTTDDNNDGDPNNDRVQYGRSIPIFPVDGSFNTDEAFGELTAQLISPQNDVPGIYRLELHGAARYVDNSAAGGDWTWTIEGRWAPIRDVAFRGNFTRAVRAPAITELFNPSSSFFTFATDPCDRNQLDNGPDPATRQANCAAVGLPTTFSALSAQRSFPGGIIGNADLENERSNAWSVGAVLTPRFIPNLRVSVDYLDIKLNNAISNLSASRTVANCYDAPDFPNNPFCDLVGRDPATGQLNFVQTSFFNAAQFRYKGILAALDYSINTPFLGAQSRLSFNATYQYLDTLNSRATADSAPATLDGSIGYPHHSAVVNVSYNNGPYLIYTSFNYTGSVDIAADEAPNFRQFEHVGDFLVVNSGLAINVNDHMRLRFIVDNLFDVRPPFPIPGGGGAATYFTGILGRYYRVGASVTF